MTVSPIWRRERLYANLALDHQIAARANNWDIDAQGMDALDELDELWKGEGVEIDRAWLLGTKLNLPASEGKQLELMGSGADIVHFDTDDSELTVTPGAMALVSDTDNLGYMSCGEAVLTNTDWCLLICLNTPSRDSSDAAQHSICLSQYNGFLDGAFWISCNQVGKYLANWVGADNVTVELMAEGVSELRPLWVFAKYTTSNRQLKWYDAFTRNQIGATMTGPVGGFSNLPLIIGRAQTISWPARVFHSVGFIKHRGDLSLETLENLFLTEYEILTRFNDQVAVFTNSVGAGAAASPITNGYVQRSKVWGATNNCFFWMRPNLGAKDIWIQALMDYEVPVGRQGVIGTIVTPRNADVSATYYLDKRISMVVFTDDQNFGLGLTSGANATYSDYLHVSDSICDALRAEVPDLKRIQGTPIAHLPVDFVTHEPLTYAYMRDSAYYERLRQFAISMRADARYDAVPDIYHAFNLGRASGEDGTPVNRFTDVANGNPLWFPSGVSVDPQHPNNLGHEQYFNVVQPAVASQRRYY